MDRIYHSTPTSDRSQARSIDPAAVATGKIVKYKEPTPKKAPRKSKGKEREKVKQEEESPTKGATLAATTTTVPSTSSTSIPTFEVTKPNATETKHDTKKNKKNKVKGQSSSIEAPPVTVNMAPSTNSNNTSTSSSSSHKRKRDKSVKGSHDRKEDRSRGRSSSRGPAPSKSSSRKKSRKVTSSPESDSTTQSSSDSEDSSSSGEEEEEEDTSSSEDEQARLGVERLRRKRARSSSRGRSKSQMRGRARSKSRGRYSDSESDEESSAGGRTIFAAITAPNGDTRMRKIDPAVHYSALLEQCHSLSNINQAIPILLSYQMDGLTVQLKDEEDLRVLLEAAVLRDLKVHIRIQKVEATPPPPPPPTSLPTAASVVVSNGTVDSPQVNKRKADSQKGAGKEKKVAKGRTSIVKATEQKDSETSEDEPLSMAKGGKVNGHSSISLQTKDDVPLAKVVIKEGEGNSTNTDATKAAPAAVNPSKNGVGEAAKEGEASATPVKKEKRKRRSAEEIALDKERKEAEKAAKAAAKEAAKEAKKEERRKERQAKKAAEKEKEKLEKQEALRLEEEEKAKKLKEEEEKKAKEEEEKKAREEEEAKKASEAEAAAKKKQAEEAKAKTKAKKSPNGKAEPQTKPSGDDSSTTAVAATPSKEPPAEKQTKAAKEKARKSKAADDKAPVPSTPKEINTSETPSKDDESNKKVSPAKKAGETAASKGATATDSPKKPAPAKAASNADSAAEQTSTEKKGVDSNGTASTKEAAPRPAKPQKKTYECLICFGQDHSMMQCPIIAAGAYGVEGRLQQLKEKKKHKTKLENEACRLLEGWLQSNRQHEEKEKQGLILFRRTHPDHEISKALSEQERQEDEAEQREINAAMERERQKIKERAEKTRTPSMSPSMGRESVRDIIDKVRRGAPDVGKRASPVNALDASSEVDQLEGTQSSPGLYPPLPRSVSKRGAASSPTPSESELATSPMLMASGGLKNPLMDNIKEVDLPPSVDTSEQEGPSSDRSSDTSDDSADEDELEESDDEPEESKSGGEKDLRDTSESIATSSDPEEKGGQDGEVEEEVDEEEEEDQIEATPAPAKTNAKSGWMPSLGSIFGLKSSQDTPIAEKEIVAATQDSGPPSAQRSRAGAVGTKADPVTPSFSARPRLTGGTRLSELDTSKVRSSFSQPNTPIGGGLVASSQPTMGKSSVPAKRRAEISFDSDSDEDDQPSEDSDSDNDIRKRPSASLPIAKRAGQKQSKRPRSSLLAKMTPS